MLYETAQKCAVFCYFLLLFSANGAKNCKHYKKRININTM